MLQKNAPEHERAKAWRERNDLSVAELAARTGYSVESIYCFERGLTPQRDGRKPTKIKDWVMQRYRMTCAGVSADLRAKQQFDW